MNNELSPRHSHQSIILFEPPWPPFCALLRNAYCGAQMPMPIHHRFEIIQIKKASDTTAAASLPRRLKQRSILR